jgi:CRISPR-associated helicase Cas3
MPPEPSFSVESYSLALVERPGLRHPLYEHQAEVWDRWATDKTTLLAAKTGAGKTRAAMLPIMKNSGYGVAVYPTNELLRDQLRAVEAMALGEGIKTVVWRPGTDPAGYSEADTILVPVDGPILDKWQAQTHCKSRAETLRRLLEPDKSKIVFTNPDILFGILAMRYGAEGIGSLPKYETLIFDEFHLYFWLLQSIAASQRYSASRCQADLGIPVFSTNR